jgi:hypothetical protein
VSHAVGDFFPHEKGGSATADICKMTSCLAHANLVDGSATAEESQLVSIFKSFIKKLKTAAPRSGDEDCASAAKPFLMKVATLQRGLLSAVKKVTEQQHVLSATPSLPQGSSVQAHDPAVPTHESNTTYHQYQRHEAHQYSAMNTPVDASQCGDPLNLGYFDNLATSGYQIMQQPPMDEWLWDMVVNDGNMFTL